MFVIFILAGFGQSWFPFLLCRHAKTKLEEGEEEGPGREKRSANCLRYIEILADTAWTVRLTASPSSSRSNGEK